MIETDDLDFLCDMPTQSIKNIDKSKFNYRGVKEFFLPRPPREYIGIIPVGSLTMIAADGASGKTQFVLWTLLKENKHKSMFISAEMSDEDFRSRGEQISRGLGITKQTSNDYIGLGFDTVVGFILSDKVEELVEFLIRNEIKVLAIDSFSATFGGTDENNAVEGTKYLNAIRVIRERTDCKTVIFIHHVTRGTNHSRGTTALPNGCDNVINISVIERGSTHLKISLRPSKTRNGAHQRFSGNLTWSFDNEDNEICVVEIYKESDDITISDEEGRPVGRSGKLWDILDEFENGGSVQEISDLYFQTHQKKIQQIQLDRLVQEKYAVKKGNLYFSATKTNN